MVWIRARNSALAGLAPLVCVSPRGICIETTQTDLILSHTCVENPLCPRGLHQFAVVTAVPQGLQAYMKALQVRPFCNFATPVSLQQ